ncbi:heat-inducible transcriptional repressor HrcA [Candidatus Protochlamydia phocaeensis]|uniref:heat-inducible transcriptional repressor HrcA n=1 Tax=Candidatus Protochlamydia phocaeensis TaxID=1414722 RepID=UPI000837FD3E|nr:heat-inducible transcriptional repressor HrcA [Candidatus Protochlamydia phocaeensis]
MKSVPIKRLGKQDRERKVLLGLVDYYIRTGKPVGSNTLKEAGFGDLSSATIRNYFANLEEEGYLLQSHSSGGRIPTHLAYRAYAHAHASSDKIGLASDSFADLKEVESREIAAFLQQAAEKLSQVTNCAVFLSAPRFDHDFIRDLKLVPLDAYRCLCILITDFGVIQTEVMHLPVKLSSFAIKRIECYFHWRLTNLGQPENLEPEEEAIGQSFYNELMLRYIVGYSNFIDEDLYRTGFSRLLVYPDFQDTSLLASGLSLFENAHSMRLLLKECKALDQLKFWIGDDLDAYASSSPSCSVLAIPYYINKKAVGAVGLLGPMRMPYQTLFQVLREFSENVSETLTRNIYKFKISFRQPETNMLYLQKEEHRLIGQSRLMLLEDKRETDNL